MSSLRRSGRNPLLMLSLRSVLADFKRYKISIAYRGTNYYGWQIQIPSKTYKKPIKPGEGLPTIQAIVRKALGLVLGHPVNLVGSSRTDSGVHAKAQIAHFDTTSVQIPAEGLRMAVNHQLPDDIVIHEIEEVPIEFNAIFHTARKRYQYYIWNALDRPVFLSDLCWHRWQVMDIDAMKEAASYLVGTHDFASFAKVGHGRTGTVRTVYECSISYRAPRLVFGVEGSGFLWQMVRIIVGTLVQVGIGRCTVEEVKRMLEAKDRREGGPTAPPQGLYLQWIKYHDRSSWSPDYVESDDEKLSDE